jgi:hypothetical protein
MSREDNCRNCRFFQLSHDAEVNAAGQCRRFSPVPVYTQYSTVPTDSLASWLVLIEIGAGSGNRSNQIPNETHEIGA